VGEDTFVRPAELRTLRRQCRKNGVGLIVVNRRGGLRLAVFPRPRHTFNDYLSRYGRQREITEVIGRRPEYGATPSERRQNRQRFVNIGLSLLLMALLILFGYERNYGPVVPDPFVGLNERVDCPSAEDGRGNYVVVDTIVAAGRRERRITELRAAGLRGMQMVATDCLDGAKPGGRWAVTTGARYSTLREAERAVQAYRRLREELGLGGGNPYSGRIKSVSGEG
jgi:hypothetical protein